jgi:DUF1009 family protein
MLFKDKNDVKKEKLAIVAGRGSLPKMLINECRKRKQEFTLFLLEGEEYAFDYSPYQPLLLKYGPVEEFLQRLKENNVRNIVFIGAINKPNFSAIKNVDKKGAVLLAKILANKILGDDAVLRTVINFLEKEGLNFVPIEQLLNCVISTRTTLTRHKPDREDFENIDLGVRAMKAFSAFDVGQSVIVAQKQIIAVEAVEGTDAMIKRCGDLRITYKKNAILVKMKKPKQNTKVDLPTIGFLTIENCVSASIKGVAIQANSTLILDREDVIDRANEMGIFITVF